LSSCCLMPVPWHALQSNDLPGQDDL
jgi:hypothetical protein